MESEKVKEIRKALEFQRDGLMYLENNCAEIVYCKDILTLINELESENKALQKGVKRLKKRYEETITKNADECVKKFCETTMYHEQEKLVNENQELKVRLAELEKENQSLKESIEYGNEVCKECQSDKDKGAKWKLKQFAERLKERLYNFQTWEVPYKE